MANPLPPSDIGGLEQKGIPIPGAWFVQSLFVGRVWWLPRVVAKQSRISFGVKAVVGKSVYVGPLANTVGWLWTRLGRETEWC